MRAVLRTWLGGLSVLLAALACDGGAPPPAPAASPARASGTTPAKPPSQADVDAAIARTEIDDPTVTLAGSPRTARNPVDAPPFTRRQATEVGVALLGMMSPDEFSPPFVNGRGLAAGDVDRDGRADIAIATERGIELYRNDSGIVFVPQPLDVPRIADLNTIVVAFADVNDDGWLDLFVTSYMTGNHVVLNDGAGGFDASGWRAVPHSPPVLTTALAFGDVDEDGDLDAFTGNWYYGSYHQIPPGDSTNFLLLRDGDDWTGQPMRDEILGETLAVLLSDFDMDGHLDLVVGNDFGPPDIYYTGDGRGGFRMLHRTEEIVPESTESTMSIDTADFDNDLDLDVFITQIADGVPQQMSETAHYKQRMKRAYCDEVVVAEQREQCREQIRAHDIYWGGSGEGGQYLGVCERIEDAQTRWECENELLLYEAIMGGKQEVCDRIDPDAESVRRRCHAYFKPGVGGTEEQYLEAIPQVSEKNVFLRANGYGRFDNVAERLGVHISAWSWNSLFFDADNDEWQDIYVVNGTWVDRVQTSQKFFFHNQQGERFEEATDAFGLQSFLLQSAYVFFDLEGDGDLDLLVNGAQSPFWLYVNNEASNNVVLFELRDHRGNRGCVGCKVTIRYGPDGEDGPRAQLRELKLGGGYHSFNPLIAHFGLGTHDTVREVVVDWSTGGRTRVTGSLPANALYTVTRGHGTAGDED